MLPKYEILEIIIKEKVVAVIRGENAKEAADIAKGSIKGGIRAIELTYTTPQAGKVFEQLYETDALFGAGTVLDAETARHAIIHGAKFIVSPYFKSEVAILCNRYAIPYLPGCMTLQEINEAIECGSDIVKLFPANQFEPSIISAIQGPLPHVRLMPTGGINRANIQEWFHAGAVAAGIGSDLTKAYRKGGEAAVTQLAKEYIDLVMVNNQMHIQNK